MNESFIQSLLNYFTKPKTGDDAVPDGACPNCWGHYEYDNEIRKVIRDRQIDVENHQVARAFIEDFVVQKVEGIQLREENNVVRCPSCGKAA